MNAMTAKACLLSILCLLVAPKPLGVGGTTASAHDHNHPDLDRWYESLQSKGGKRCCGGPTMDAKTLDGPEWEIKDGHYRVFLQEAWWDVPDDAVINEPNKDGRALVWPVYYSSFGGPLRVEIRCFMPGSMT